MKDNKLNNNTILFTQIPLTIFGTILSVVLFFQTLKSPTILGILGSITYMFAYIVLILYTVKNYKEKDDFYFQMVIYTYASILGIQILQSGNYISGYGLKENIAILINCFNLISFANIIKFADNLNNRKKALSYSIIAIALKLMVEVYLIIKMIKFIKLIHIFMSLSIPILGITIIITYIYRLKRLKK